MASYTTAGQPRKTEVGTKNQKSSEKWYWKDQEKLLKKDPNGWLEKHDRRNGIRMKNRSWVGLTGSKHKNKRQPQQKQEGKGNDVQLSWVGIYRGQVSEWPESAWEEPARGRGTGKEQIAVFMLEQKHGCPALKWMSGGWQFLTTFLGCSSYWMDGLPLPTV